MPILHLGSDGYQSKKSIVYLILIFVTLELFQLIFETISLYDLLV